MLGHPCHIKLLALLGDGDEDEDPSQEALSIQFPEPSINLKAELESNQYPPVHHPLIVGVEEKCFFLTWNIFVTL